MIVPLITLLQIPISLSRQSTKGALIPTQRQNFGFWSKWVQIDQM